jgi:hypothetical protein
MDPKPHRVWENSRANIFRKTDEELWNYMQTLASHLLEHPESDVRNIAYYVMLRGDRLRAPHR